MRPSSSDPAWQHPARWASFCTLAAYAGLYEVENYDTPFHIAAGELALRMGTLPTRDTFSFTHRGALWVNHSWSFDVLMALLYRASGYAAISLYQALIAALLGAAMLLGIGREPRRLWLALPLALLPFAAFREVLAARPHAFGFLCISLGVWLLQASKRRPALGALGIPLYAVFCTAHGSHLVTLVLTALAVTFAALQRQWLRLRWLGATLLAEIGLLVTLAGAALHQGTEHLGSDFLESNIPEWQPITAADLLTSWPGRAFLLCLGLSVLGAISNLRKPQRERADAPYDLITYALFAALVLLSLLARRMLPLFLWAGASLWLPFAVDGVLLLGRRWGGFSLRSAVLVSLTGCALSLAAIAVQNDRFRFGLGLREDRFPVGAVRAIGAGELGPIERLYNAYNYGGYLMQQGIPQGGVFVDGRAITVYPADFLQTFTAAYGDPSLFEQLCAQYRVDSVLLPVESQRSGILLRYLANSPTWQRRYRDPVATVFVHR